MDVWCFVKKEQWTSDVSPLWLVLLFRVGFLSRSSRRWGPSASLWFQCGDTKVSGYNILLSFTINFVQCWPALLKAENEVVNISVLFLHRLNDASQIRPGKTGPRNGNKSFSNRLDFKIQWTHFNDVWMVSSTRSIASLTWSRRRWIWIKM